MSIQSRLALFCVMCLCMTAVSADKLYQWVDDQGHVHYSQTPPPAAVTNSKVVNIHVSQPDPATAQAAPQPGQPQSPQGQPQQQAAQAPPPPDPITAAKQQQCAGMHAQMSAYTHSDAAPSAERKQAIADLKAQIAKECD